MTIHEALEKAIEGGYKQDIDWMGPALERDMFEIYLDLNFWKCLGKAMGWYHIEEWKSYWHSLISHLAEGKSIESYFKKLK